MNATNIRRTAVHRKGLTFSRATSAALRVPALKRPLGWREKALADIAPLRSEAFVIRAEPLSDAERADCFAKFAAIERQLRWEPADVFDPPAAPAPRSALAELSFDIHAECTLANAALMRPQTIIGAGLRASHFHDPALGILFAVCEHLHVKDGVALPFSVLPDRFPWRSWWRAEWEGDGRHIFMFILETAWPAEPMEAAQTVIELARGRGVA